MSIVTLNLRELLKTSRDLSALFSPLSILRLDLDKLTRGSTCLWRKIKTQEPEQPDPWQREPWPSLPLPFLLSCTKGTFQQHLTFFLQQTHSKHLEEYSILPLAKPAVFSLPSSVQLCVSSLSLFVCLWKQQSLPTIVAELWKAQSCCQFCAVKAAAVAAAGTDAAGGATG